MYDTERNLLAKAKFLVNSKYDFDSTLKLILSQEERKGKEGGTDRDSGRSRHWQTWQSLFGAPIFKYFFFYFVINLTVLICYDAQSTHPLTHKERIESRINVIK